MSIGSDRKDGGLLGDIPRGGLLEELSGENCKLDLESVIWPGRKKGGRECVRAKDGGSNDDMTEVIAHEDVEESKDEDAKNIKGNIVFLHRIRHNSMFSPA